MSNFAFEHTGVNTGAHIGVDKVSRYKWKTKGTPGKLAMLDKNILQFNPDYQRELIPSKVRDITSDWSWVSLGAIVVGHRDGVYWVVDGQHRVVAAKRRSDVRELPCVIFETEGVREEAQGFIALNTGRKPVTAIAKHRAYVMSGDEVSVFVQACFDELGLEIKNVAKSADDIKCVAWCLRRARESKERFYKILTLGVEIARNQQVPVAERVLDGLWFIDLKVPGGVSDKRLLGRIKDKGHRVLLDAATRGAAYYTKGGGRIYAHAMMMELNKGLQKKFSAEGLEAQ